MASQLKKYGLFVILIGLSFSSYWFFYRSHWGVSINKEHHWKYSFQPKSVISFNTIDWKNSKEKQTISEEQKTSNLIFQTEFNLKDHTKIREGFLEFEYKNSVKVLINGLKCTSIERNLITSSLEGNHIRIEEYWRPRKLTLTQKMLSSSLKNGKNSITIIITNVEDIKTVESSRKQLSFLTKGQGNHLETNFKIQKPPRYFSESNLPIFKINTNNSVIPDKPKINASLNVINISSKINKLLDPANSYNIKIERRGNTSQTFSKKSYGFNVYNNQGLKTSVKLLGMPASKKWVLYGPYADKSLIRNALTYSIYHQMGNYAPRTQFVNLVINNNYRGIYVLTEKIQLSLNHLNIPPFTINKNDSSLFSGGYLLEIDRNEWKGVYPPSNDTSAIPTSYMVKAPKRKKINPLIEQVIKTQFNAFEQHLYENDNIYNYLDINSFVDYLIITEFTKNIDGYCLSTFLYNKDISKKTPKFYLGPIWDYNFSLGLTDYREGYNPEGYVYSSTKYIPFWWKKLLADKIFNTALKKRYFELRKTVLSNKNIESTIDSFYLFLKKSQALNFKKWPVLNSSDFWPNYYLGKTYKDEIDYLKLWINKRLFFLDNDILAKEKKGEIYYEISIRNNHEWMNELRGKAKKKGKNINEIIKIDAKYMAKKQ